MLTLDRLTQLFPNTDDNHLANLVVPLHSALTRFNITTPLRVAGFVAQVGHESMDMTVLRENLNYRPERLRQVFPKYFPTTALANEYGRKPEKIANRVYGGRMGNGNEASGDGYRFCGRGLIQLTGRNNYSAFAKYMGMDVMDTPAYLETLEGASMAAAWFWDSRNINVPADRRDVVTMTKLINGGTIGLEDRRARYQRACRILGA